MADVGVDNVGANARVLLVIGIYSLFRQRLVGIELLLLRLLLD